MQPTARYNLLVCNPPYVRHHLIESSEKLRLIEKTLEFSGERLSGLAGLYCHFMLQSLLWLDEGGVAAWLVPSEFLDVNYGRGVKRFLTDSVELLRIHRFAPDDVQFGDALVSSAVVVFRRTAAPPAANAVASFTFGGTLSEPRLARDIRLETLRCEPKWSRFPVLEAREAGANTARISDYFTVKRGIATGSNSYFILSEDQIAALGLPTDFFRPVLPSARYMRETEIRSDDNGNPLLPQRLFLLDCRLSEAEVQENYPALWSYLLLGKDTVASGYLCQSRKCWYHQEQREPPPIICTYMGRGRSGDGKAFRFILNHSRAIVTNSYLALYPKRELARQIEKTPALKTTIWRILNRLEPESLVGEGRVYGGGLNKIEPAELANVPVPEIEALVPLGKDSDVKWEQMAM